MIGNREIKRPRICPDFKTANFNSRKFKWGYSIEVHNVLFVLCIVSKVCDVLNIMHIFTYQMHLCHRCICYVTKDQTVLKNCMKRFLRQLGYDVILIISDLLNIE